MLSFLFIVVAMFPTSSTAQEGLNARIEEAVEKKLPYLLDLYQWFHANPELSLNEKNTAARFASSLESLGWWVREGVGGHGVVALLKNGEGPTVLARVDMDALPIQEETGLEYASVNEGVMHACGHDTHMAIGVGLASALWDLREHWSGTAILIGQPGEEVGLGARNMIQDVLFPEIIPGKPDACLSVHTFNDMPAGKVGIREGWATANVDSVDVVLFGKGGHGAWPHNTVDPIVMASEFVLKLQTIVSRKIDPFENAVISVGSIHGGTKHNIIPNEVRLQITVRSYGETREKLLEEIRHLAETTAQAHRAPKPPEVTVDPDWVPAGYHEPELCRKVRGALEDLFGGKNVLVSPPMMGGEDFSRFGKHFDAPGLQFRVGGVKAALMDHKEAIPALHSSRWAPDAEPTIRTGTMALTKACLDLLSHKPEKEKD